MALNPLQKHHRIMVDSVISVKDVQPEPFQRQYWSKRWVQKLNNLLTAHLLSESYYPYPRFV